MYLPGMSTYVCSTACLVFDCVPTFALCLLFFLRQVRSTAVKQLVDLVNADPTVLPKSILEAVGHRIKDRKVRTFSLVTARGWWRWRWR